MEILERHSPVSFNSKPLNAEVRDNWTVVLEYEAEGDGPYLIDLSHKTRWDVQDMNLSEVRPAGPPIPERIGHCAFGGGVLINRMNRTQASVWFLGGDQPGGPVDKTCTETTDATLFLALLGKGLFSITEKLTSLDLQDPARTPPVLFQGPFSHVPCQIVVFSRDNERPGILLTCSRGYAMDMVHAILEAGMEVGLRPAGEKRFQEWIGETK